MTAFISPYDLPLFLPETGIEPDGAVGPASLKKPLRFVPSAIGDTGDIGVAATPRHLTRPAHSAGGFYCPCPPSASDIA